MRSYILSFFACVLMTLVACKEKAILSPKVMEDILYEIYIADAMSQYNHSINGRKINDELVEQRQRSFIFEKYHIRKEDYDSSLAVYGRDLKLYLEICNNVEKRLKAEEHRLINDTLQDYKKQRLIDSLVQIGRELLYEDAQGASYAQLRLTPSFEFDLPRESVLSIGDTLQGMIQLYAYPAIKPEEAPQLILQLSYEKDSVDTHIMSVLPDREAKYYFQETIPEGLKVKDIKGRLLFDPAHLQKHFVRLKRITLLGIKKREE